MFSFLGKFAFLGKSLTYHIQTLFMVLGILGFGGVMALMPHPPKPTVNHVLSTENNSPTPTASPTPTPSPKPGSTPTPSATPGAPGGKPPITGVDGTKLPLPLPPPPSFSIIGWPLYVEPDTDAAQQADSWSSSRPADAAKIRKIANTPQSKWLGDWNPDPYADASEYIAGAAAAHALPVVTLYDLPGRDCGSYSAGGATSESIYLAWIARVAAAAGQQTVAYILEPDALAELDCFNGPQQTGIYHVLGEAVSVLKHDSHAVVYIDAGNPNWQTASTMAARLSKANIAGADGFALNVSNFMTTSENTAYGNQISGLLGGKHFVIDTSRNGLGATNQWCNPPGRALGTPPTTRTNVPLVDAYLWVKTPGESDGDCGRGEPAAGVWWADYALGLAQLAGY